MTPGNEIARLKASGSGEQKPRALGERARGFRRANRIAALLLGTFVWSTRARRADEQLPAVLVRDVAAVRAVRAVLGLIAFHRDHGARQQRVLVEAAAQQRVRRARFHHPALDL